MLKKNNFIMEDGGNYMKKQSIILSCLFFSFLFIMTACSSNSFDNGNSNENSDVVTVYDPNGKKLTEFTEEEDVVYFSELIGNSVENMDEDNVMSTLYKSVPKDAELSFKYVFTHTKDNGKQTTVDFYVYKNYPYLTLKGIPVISPLTWELSEEDNNILQKPLEYKN